MVVYPTSLDLLIEGRAYINGSLMEVSIGIVGGKIAWIGKYSKAPPAAQVVHLQSKEILLPGMVDMHVHMRDLEEASKEDWYTGTLSALAGGVTFVADMPNNRPPARSLEVLKVKQREASRKALVDYGFYAGLPASSAELSRMIEFGVVGLKLYPDDLERDCLVESLRLAAAEGLLVVAHAEDPTILRLAEAIEPKDIRRHCLLRPIEAEAAGVRLLDYLRSKLGFQLHLTHISSARALFTALGCKLRGGVTLDTAIHYLFLDEGIVESVGGIAKVNPPLRRERDVRVLLTALAAGMLDAVVSDHAPHRLEEKLSCEYEKTPPGFPGLELCLPLLLTLIREKGLPLTILDCYSKFPARLLGLLKGAISVGYEADLTVVDLSEKWRVRGECLSSKAKYTPFEGFEVVGVVRKVFIRGVLAYDSGEVMVDGGFGRRYRPIHKHRVPEA